MEWVQVISIEHLKNLSSQKHYDDCRFAEFYIILADGLARSGKRICYHREIAFGLFDVHNECDDTWQEGINEEELNKLTMIPEAIKKGAFYFTGLT